MAEKSLKQRAQELSEMACQFEQELEKTGTQQDFLEIIAINLADIIQEMVEEIDDLKRRIERLEREGTSELK